MDFRDEIAELEEFVSSFENSADELAGASDGAGRTERLMAATLKEEAAIQRKLTAILDGMSRERRELRDQMERIEGFKRELDSYGASLHDAATEAAADYMQDYKEVFQRLCSDSQKLANEASRANREATEAYGRAAKEAAGAYRESVGEMKDELARYLRRVNIAVAIMSVIVAIAVVVTVFCVLKVAPFVQTFAAWLPAWAVLLFLFLIGAIFGLVAGFAIRG